MKHILQKSIPWALEKSNKKALKIEVTSPLGNVFASYTENVKWTDCNEAIRDDMNFIIVFIVILNWVTENQDLLAHH